MKPTSNIREPVTETYGYEIQLDTTGNLVRYSLFPLWLHWQQHCSIDPLQKWWLSDNTHQKTANATLSWYTHARGRLHAEAIAIAQAPPPKGLVRSLRASWYLLPRPTLKHWSTQTRCISNTNTVTLGGIRRTGGGVLLSEFPTLVRLPLPPAWLAIICIACLSQPQSVNLLSRAETL